jgi:ABC-2 type transport system permease protein
VSAGGFATPGSTGWFVAHELRLSWRDWMSMMTAGNRRREAVALVAVGAFVAGLHALAYFLLRDVLAAGVASDIATFVLLTGMMLLGFSLMLSQAIESVTRAFYSRSDLDLILSSPAPSRRLFTVRIAAIVLTTAALATMMSFPFVMVATWLDGARWLAVFPVILALAAFATALAVVITIALFKTIGARRTRLIAQIVAAVVGATFLIGTQVAAILAFGEMSRIALFSSADVIAAAPDASSFIWIPARALMGEVAALIALVAVCAVVFAAVVFAAAGRFGTYVLLAASIAEAARVSDRPTHLACKSPESALRAKEFRLLQRDPWLVSQSLMQILYLIPPAVLLWQNFGDKTGALAILAPVLVMAVGQLAGGLAWLAISGEDAPDLVATAPIQPRTVTVAKVQSVMLVVAACAAPFVIAMAFSDLWVAGVTAIAVLVSATASLLIQLWFRVTASRRMFRRRQTASRTSTIAEAFSSISWAGTAALAAAGSWFALLFAALALAVLAIAWTLSPKS